MRLYYSIKFFFKSLKNNFFVNICMFILLPIILALFMNNIAKSAFESPNITEIININFVDNDNTPSSSQLINYIETNYSELFDLDNKDDDLDLEITIPNGYEISLANNNKNSISIKELHKRSSNSSNIVKNIIDNYHEELYFNDVGTSFIENKFIDANISQSSSEYFAISFLGYLVISLVFNNIASTYVGEVSNSYVGESSGLNKRVYSMPISRICRLVLNFINLFIYASIFLLLYVLINRFIGIAFTGDIYLLICICIISSVFIASTSKFIDVFLPKKYSITITCILLLVQVVLGGMVTPFIDTLSKFAKLSPTYIISDLFTNYSIYNNFDAVSGSCTLLLLISLVLFILSALKEKYHWREI